MKENINNNGEMWQWKNNGVIVKPIIIMKITEARRTRQWKYVMKL
jgi:hypothetical protein